MSHIPQQKTVFLIELFLPNLDRKLHIIIYYPTPFSIYHIHFLPLQKTFIFHLSWNQW